MIITVTEPSVLPAGPRKYIHVNRNTIARNLKEGRDDPVYTVKVRRGGKDVNYYCRSFRGRVEGVQSFPDGLPCGAKAYLVSYDEIELLP